MAVHHKGFPLSREWHANLDQLKKQFTTRLRARVDGAVLPRSYFHKPSPGPPANGREKLFFNYETGLQSELLQFPVRPGNLPSTVHYSEILLQLRE